MTQCFDDILPNELTDDRPQERHTGCIHRPSAETYLDPQETDSQLAVVAGLAVAEDLTSGEQAFRHSGWRRNRTATFHALQRIGINQSRLDNFRHCGENVWVLRHRTEADRYRLVGDYCHDRWCQPCQKARGTIACCNLRDRLQHRPTRLLTLTVVHNRHDSLAKLLATLRGGFQALRRSKLWQTHVSGGAFVLEITWSADHGWHPHLHVVLESKYIPYSELREAWRTASGGSYILDIRRIDSPEYAANYLAKYLAKPLTDRLFHHPDRLQEAIVALHGCKLLGTFGSWRKWHLLREPTVNEDDWIPMMPLTLLLRAVRENAPWATKAFLCITNHRHVETTNLAQSGDG